MKKRESQADRAEAMKDLSLAENSPESQDTKHGIMPHATTSHNHTASQDSTKSTIGTSLAKSEVDQGSGGSLHSWERYAPLLTSRKWLSS